MGGYLEPADWSCRCTDCLHEWDICTTDPRQCPVCDSYELYCTTGDLPPAGADR